MFDTGCVRLGLYARQQPMGRSLSVTPWLSFLCLCGLWESVGPVGGGLHFGLLCSWQGMIGGISQGTMCWPQTQEHVGCAPGLAIAGFGGLKCQVRLSLPVQQLHCSCGS